MTATWWACARPGCGQLLPHDCEAERSLVALALVSEPNARRILPRVQITAFMDSRLRGVVAQLRERWTAYPLQLGTFNVWDCEADPSAIDQYIETVNTRALQRRQLDTLARLAEQVYREPMRPRDFDWAVLNASQPMPQPGSEPQRHMSLVDLVVDPEDEAA